MNINIQTIPHSAQRYETVGDWWFDSTDTLHIRVSDMDNPAYEFLVARHEMDEAMICRHRGIDEKAITAFDVKFEQERAAGLHSDTAEPGADPHAPYFDPHLIATSFERLMCPYLGVDWQAYDDAVVSLANGKTALPEGYEDH